MAKIEVGQYFKTNEGGTVMVMDHQSHREVCVQHQDTHGYVDVVEAGDLRRGGT